MFKIKMIHVSSYPMLQHVGWANDKCAEAVFTFQCTGVVTVCEHMEICESCRVLCCEVFVQYTHTYSPLLPGNPVFRSK